MTNLAIGKSVTSDARAAVREATAGALHGVENPVFALVFSTDQYQHEQLAAAMSAALGPIPWAGAAFSGVLAGSELLPQGLVVGIIDSSDLRVGIGTGGPVSGNGTAAGRSAVAMALDALPAPSAARSRGVIVLSDALTGNAADIVRGAAEEAGTGVAWAGGGAGDNLQFVRTAQYVGGRAVNDHVVAVVLDATSPIAAGVRHGWRPYGPPTIVTRTHGPVAVELDYENAFDVYQRVAAKHGDVVSRVDFALFAMTHPLGIPQANGDHLIRDPLAVERDGGLRCVADIPEGCIVRVMEGDRAALLTAARAAANDARAAIPGPLGGAFVFDCVSRALLLRDSIHDELVAFQSGIGAAVPMMGCLTFGEVGALGRGMPQFHNKTAVILALGA